MEELRRLREEIDRCQRLAANITDAETLTRLRAYIEELEERERQLEDKTPPEAGTNYR